MLDKNEKIAIGSDHAGYDLKEEVKRNLTSDGYQVVDFGTDSCDSMDYPDVAHPLAKSIHEGKNKIGILICGSGNGVNMVANKYALVRAALCWNQEIAELARKHNNANILSLPARFITKEQAWEIVKVFLNTEFEGGRHNRRVEKIVIQ